MANLLFTSEDKLVLTFVNHLESMTHVFRGESYIREFDYSSGRTDVLALSLSGEVIAFEAKLKNWRKAIHQAWRNTSFVNRTYVVLPRDCALSAKKHQNEFLERGVGLCIVDSDRIEIVIESEVTEPVIPWLHTKARKMLSADESRSFFAGYTQNMHGT